MPTAEAKVRITAWLESEGLGRKTVNYKLRRSFFSRRRYWETHFPSFGSGTPGALFPKRLPNTNSRWFPPPLDDYKPTPDGRLPSGAGHGLGHLRTDPPETNTMPQWAGSCWYYLRYLDARNGRGCFHVVTGIRLDAAECWRRFPAQRISLVDSRCRGTEHAVPALYARFGTGAV